jgi:hypothetical protein
MDPTPKISFLIAAALLAGVAVAAAETSPGSLLTDYSRMAGAPGRAVQGRDLFTTRHGGEWACSDCHTPIPSAQGRHASTGKAIQPLAPVANPDRFTDAAKVEKWFRRNCRDVLSRECTPQEKADVLAWLLTIKS